MFVGTLDPRFDDCLRIAEQLRTGGAEVHVDRIDDLGHDYPIDFAQRLPAALQWILSDTVER